MTDDWAEQRPQAATGQLTHQQYKQGREEEKEERWEGLGVVIEARTEHSYKLFPAHQVHVLSWWNHRLSYKHTMIFTLKSLCE